MNETVPEAEAKRASQIASIHGLADWLAANPNVPVPALSLHRHLHHLDGTDEENLAAVRKLAESLGVDTDEHLPDRTVTRLKVNEHVWYELFAWHRSGRDGMAELARLRAEVEQLRAERSGQLYSRADDADDPTPVSPARTPLQTGAVTDEGLVDEVAD